MEKLSGVKINQPLIIFRSSIAPRFCAICNAEDSMTSMDTESVLNGEKLSYNKMLLICYNIQLCHLRDESTQIEICQECINRLEESYCFRKKVEFVDENFQLSLQRNEKNNKLMEMFLTRYSFDNKRTEKLNEILLKKRIKSEILEKLKGCKEIYYNSCIVKRLDSDKPKLIKKNKKKIKNDKKVDRMELKNHLRKKNRNHKEDKNDLDDFEFDDNFLGEDFFSNDESSDDSNDIKSAPNLVKQVETPKKEIFLIPALELSATFCPICGMVPNSRQSLIRHYYDTHFPCFLCHLCGYGTTLRDSFTGHMKTHRGVKYSCSSCPKTFFSPISRYHHEKAIHKKIPLFNCSMCLSTFSHSVTRRKHMSEKHGVQCKTHPCTDCGKVFFSGHRLSVHIKRLHLQHRPFSCSVCGFSFFQNCDLRDHMTKHTGAKDFHCEQCGKSFSRRACLTEHLKIHANIRNYMCHLCDKTFIQKVSLKGHMKTHEKNDKLN